MIWWGPNVASDLLGLMTHPQDWAQARSHLSTLQLYIQWALADRHSDMGVGNNYYTNLRDSGFFRQIPAWGLQCAVEGAAVKDWSPDGVSALHGWSMAIDRIRQADGQVDAVVLDEPLGSGIGTWDERLAGTCRVIDGLRTLGVSSVGLVEPYPACQMADIIHWMEAIQQAGSSPSFLHLDVDRYAIRDQKLKPHDVMLSLQWAQDQCAAWGIPFGIVIFGQRATTDQQYVMSAKTWAAQAQRDLKPGFRRIVQSWEEPYPPMGHTQPANLPESDPTSHAGLVVDIANRMTT